MLQNTTKRSMSQVDAQSPLLTPEYRYDTEYPRHTGLGPLRDDPFESTFPCEVLHFTPSLLLPLMSYRSPNNTCTDIVDVLTIFEFSVLEENPMYTHSRDTPEIRSTTEDDMAPAALAPVSAIQLSEDEQHLQEGAEEVEHQARGDEEMESAANGESKDTRLTRADITSSFHVQAIYLRLPSTAQITSPIKQKHIHQDIHRATGDCARVH
jgi:hypothetical protein